MSFSLLATLDSSMGPAVAAPKQRRLGRRFVLGGAACGLGIAGCAWIAKLPPEQQALPALSAAAPVAALPTVAAIEPMHAAPGAIELRDWAAFRARFIQPDGRVIDTYNQGESHTESQGVGMLFAVAFNDRASFERIWNWTSTHLRRGTDALHSWRYLPGTANPVPDVNNATDGDIYIASALVRASTRWGDTEHLQAAQAIARDVLALLVRQVGGRTVLLPAAQGFEQDGHTVVNASYYAFPLIAELEGVYPSPIWGRLLDDGRKLVAEAQFGRWRLPPDWLQVSARDGSLSLAPGQPPRFSYDAVRIPLFAAWDRSGPEALQRFAAFWGQNPAQSPAWVDLNTNASAPYAACGGVVAIAKLADREVRGNALATLPTITRTDDYYSSALILLSRVAMRETGAALS